ncbi:DUF5615 family PIN-like protein [Aeoliella mucimassa]|uniref:DUF5615 domain-containing protein n=1 Tax=Aeoliella mucimassa TaxID=2527972 RepID=A0A518AIM1_9BACT|nr:DUF5615 family PIN-like protein [Aeoliella mucimassa]QDU54572.1 hypothetical protein Pan181_07550 [Aeoliella mucimassa]
MARLYSNENFPLPVVTRLRELGHDVMTTDDAGQSEQAIPDDQVLAFAIANSRAILTLNRKHFVKLHSSTPEHLGIVVCTFDPDFVAQAERIHSAIEASSPLTGQLIKVNRPA